MKRVCAHDFSLMFSLSELSFAALLAFTALAQADFPAIYNSDPGNTQPPTPPSGLAIDALRGLVMLFMLVDHVRETFYYDGDFWAQCTPGYNNNEGIAASRYTIFGDMYGPGYNAFDDLIREWRDEGSMAGMEMVRMAGAGVQVSGR